MAPSGSKRKRKTGVEGKNVSRRKGLLFLLTAIADRKGEGEEEEEEGRIVRPLFSSSPFRAILSFLAAVILSSLEKHGPMVARFSEPLPLSPHLLPWRKGIFPPFTAFAFRTIGSKGREGRRNVSLPLPAFYSFCSTSHTVKRRRERKR